MPKPQDLIHPIVREHMISQARLLRENGLTNRAIAQILHVTPSTIGKMLGKLSSTQRSESSRRARRTRRNKLTPEEAKRRRQARSARNNLSARGQNVHEPGVVTIDAPVFRASETVIRPLRDILASIHSELHAPASWDDAAGVIDIRSYHDADDYPWHDEPEPSVPTVPPDAWFRSYSAWRLRADAVYDSDSGHSHPLLIGRAFSGAVR